MSEKKIIPLIAGPAGIVTLLGIIEKLQKEGRAQEALDICNGPLADLLKGYGCPSAGAGSGGAEIIPFPGKGGDHSSFIESIPAPMILTILAALAAMFAFAAIRSRA